MWLARRYFRGSSLRSGEALGRPPAVLPLHGPDITAQVSLAPVGSALSMTGNPLTGLVSGMTPRYQQLLQPAVPLTVVSILAPTITSIVPSSGDPGDSVYAYLYGTRLSTTTSVSVSGTGVTASVLDGDDSTLLVQFDIAPSARSGLRTVTVTTSEGTSAPFAGFTVIGPKRQLNQVTSQ